MTDDVITTDVQSLEITDGLVTLYEISIGSGSNNTLYFHNEKDLDGTDSDKDIIFDSKTYISIPLVIDNITKQSDGAQNRPKLTIANVESLIKTGSKFKSEMEDGTWDATIDGEPYNAADFTIDGLIGQRFIRRRTLEKYCGSGVTAYEFPKETFIIDRVATKSLLHVEYELSSPTDLQGVRLPRRAVIGKYCPWTYQGYHQSNTKSACYWKNHKQIKDVNGYLYSFYFTKDDEPIVLASLLSGSTTSWWKGAYSSSTSYSKGEYVLSGGLYWRSEGDTNQGNTPSEESAYWQIVRTYSGWNSSTTYNIDAGSPPDFRKNPYVAYGSSTDSINGYTIWRCVQNQSSSNYKTPGTNSLYWVRGDICGKLLTSCRVRYQSTPKATHASNYAYGGIPHAELNTHSSLPFGGFPGSRKFR